MTGAGNARRGVSRLPPVSDHRLNAELRRIRVSLQITGDQAARALGWSTSKISRYEHAWTSLRVAAIREMLDFYVSRGLGRDRADSLIVLAEQDAARARPPDDRLAGADLACTVLEWAPLTVPKLLQIPAYATAVLVSRQAALALSPGEIEGMARAAGQWQERLTASPPVQLRAVLDESVLYRQAGGRAVMRQQLRHLDQAGNQADADVRIRVLPLDSGGPAGISPFAYLEYPEEHGVAAPAAVLTEDPEGPRIPDLPEKAVWQRKLAFSRLWEAAGAPGLLIKRALADAWPETAGSGLPQARLGITGDDDRAGRRSRRGG